MSFDELWGFKVCWFADKINKTPKVLTNQWGF